MHSIRVIVFTILLLLFLIPVSSAEITWEQQCSIVIHPNQNITCKDIQINDIQFSAPVRGIKDINGKITPEYTVIPSIIFDVITPNYTEKNIVLTATDSSYIEQKNKLIRIDVSGFTNGNSNDWIIENYSPKATLTIYTQQEPQLELSLISDKSQYEYKKDENINVTLILKNAGKTQLRTTKIKMDKKGLILSSLKTSSQQDFEYCCLNPDETIQYTYNFKVPEILEQTQYFVSVIIQQQDTEIEGKYFQKNATIQFTVIPQKKDGYVTIEKYIPNRFYTSDNVTVSIVVRNQGSDTIRGVEIFDDSTPLYPINSSLKQYWVFMSIEPNRQKEIRYKVYPTISGKIAIPEATVKYNYIGQNYEKASNKVDIEIINNPAVKIRPPHVKITPEPTVIKKENIIVNQTPIITVIPQITMIPSTTPYNVKISGFEGIYLIVLLLVFYFRLKS